MANQYCRIRLEPLEPRALLSHLNLAGMSAAKPMGRSQSVVLVGSIQGTENGTPQGVVQLDGSGTVTPLGDVTANGSFGGGKGAANDKGTLTFSNSQGSLTLSLNTHGYFPLRSQNAEEIRVTVAIRSASGSDAGIHVAGTINLVNYLGVMHYGEQPTVPFTAQINLKPAK